MNGSSKQINRSLRLRAGEWVEVRSAEEIVATLDGTHALDGLPFMPEMLQYCGRRFRVGKSAHKTCDVIATYVIRKMDDAVHLEDLRCDGSGHDGCQASCLIFWKEAWLKRAAAPPHADDATGTARERADDAPPSAFQLLARSTRVPNPSPPPEWLYRCQATDMLKATNIVRRRERWDPRFYLRDVTSGNVGLFELLWYGAGAAINAFMRKWFGFRFPRIKGLAKGQTPTARLDIQPGELVQVLSKDEIMRTLNAEQRNRGMWFDVEMVPYCNSTFRVLKRVERLIDEKTGRMLVLSNPALILDGVICSGHNSVDRMFCPRAIYPYWREVWVKRVNT